MTTSKPVSGWLTIDGPPGDDLPPTAEFRIKCRDLTCYLDATYSTDDQGIAAYQWDFGDGTGSNEQNLQMFFEGDGKSGMIKHDDHYRGVQHAYLEGIGCAGSSFNFVSPDFFQLVPWEGNGLRPIGYGYESVAATINMAHKIENEALELPDKESLNRRQQMIKEVDHKGIIATPANSYINELVVEAARLSILNDGHMVAINYGADPHVEL